MKTIAIRDLALLNAASIAVLSITEQACPICWAPPSILARRAVRIQSRSQEARRNQPCIQALAAASLDAAAAGTVTAVCLSSALKCLTQTQLTF